jgi:hypothetical protein
MDLMISLCKVIDLCCERGVWGGRCRRAAVAKGRGISEGQRAYANAADTDTVHIKHRLLTRPIERATGTYPRPRPHPRYHSGSRFTCSRPRSRSRSHSRSAVVRSVRDASCKGIEITPIRSELGRFRASSFHVNSANTRSRSRGQSQSQIRDPRLGCYTSFTWSAERS